MAAGLSLGASAAASSGHKDRTIAPFAFDTPSPDDVARGAQTKNTRGNRNNRTTVKQSPKPKKGKRGGRSRTPPRRSVKGQLSSATAASSSSPLRHQKPATLKVRVREDEKQRLTMVVLGHVDAGKSTMMGHLLYDLGQVDRRAMRKLEKESKECGKPSFLYAFVLDENEEERMRGVTMEVASGHFETAHRHVTLLDAPGHRDFIPSMISGAAQADVAVLVVDSAVGEFEGGFSDTGQTQEHALLALSLGVKQLLVAVNKLDVVGWDKARFDSICSVLLQYLKRIGWKQSSVRFVPVSGLQGTNVVHPPKKDCALLEWYDGPTLVDCIDAFQPQVRLDEKPLRLYVSDMVTGSGKNSVRVTGKIESGSVAQGDAVQLMPLGTIAKVKSVTILNEGPVSFGAAGESVDVVLADVDEQLVTVGNVVCSVGHPVPVVKKFRAKLRTLSRLRCPIIAGQKFTLYMQCVEIPVNVTKLLRTFDTAGKLKKKHPRRITKNTICSVEITPIRPICLETYANFPQLGRFMLRDRGDTVAACVVLKILEVV